MFMRRMKARPNVGRLPKVSQSNTPVPAVSTPNESSETIPPDKPLVLEVKDSPKLVTPESQKKAIAQCPSEKPSNPETKVLDTLKTETVPEPETNASIIEKAIKYIGILAEGKAEDHATETTIPLVDVQSSSDKTATAAADISSSISSASTVDTGSLTSTFPSVNTTTFSNIQPFNISEENLDDESSQVDDPQPLEPLQSESSPLEESLTDSQSTTPNDSTETSSVDSGIELPTPSSPVKSSKKTKPEKETSRTRRHVNKIKEPPERSKMTMMDLIYWNPSDNPMKTPVKPAVAEQKKTDPKERRKDLKSKPVDPLELEEATPAPRLKIGEDGQIILDEESLIIQNTGPDSYNVVTEDSVTTYFSFRDRLISRRWSMKETAVFYKALTIVGTDFSLMSELIQDRSRHELKLKYKREEKKNRRFVEEILNYSNASGLQEFREEMNKFYNPLSPEEEEAQAQKEAQAAKEKAATKRKRGRPKRKAPDSDAEDYDPLERWKKRKSVILDSSDESSSNFGATETTDSCVDLETADNDEDMESTMYNDCEEPVVNVAANDDKSPSLGETIPKRGRGRPRKILPQITDSNVNIKGKINGKRGRKPKISKRRRTDIENELNGDDKDSKNDQDEIVETDKNSATTTKSNIVVVSDTGEPLPFEVVYAESTTPTNLESSTVPNEDTLFTVVDMASAYSQNSDTADYDEDNELTGDEAEIAAYVTVETKKVGRRWEQVSEDEDRPKPHRPRYSDFTVSELDMTTNFCQGS